MRTAHYVETLAAFVNATEIDGVDFDYEGFNVGDPVDVKAARDFSALIVATRKALGPKSCITVCLAANFNNPFIWITPDAVAVVDHVNVMSYIWSANGDFSKSISAVEYIHKGTELSGPIPKSKIAMGIAFYGCAISLQWRKRAHTRTRTHEEREYGGAGRDI